MEDVARHYGFEVGRANFMRCPFHAGDRTASLKIYPGKGGFHCFGCGAHGTVIDFAMRLFDLDFRQALLRLNADLCLGLTEHKPSRAQASEMARKRALEAEKTEIFRREYSNRTTLYRAMWTALRAGEPTPIYYAAMRELPILDEWFFENPYR